MIQSSLKKSQQLHKLYTLFGLIIYDDEYTMNTRVAMRGLGSKH